MPNMDLKVASLNLCLGLKCKKIEIENLLLNNGISILCMQEVELESGCDPEILSIKDYNLEIELNSVKSRVGVYINKSVEYMRMSNLEGVNSHIVIIDIPNCSIKRIINVYRSFNPQNNVNAREKFKYQLEIIKKAMTECCIVIGDFNIDYAKYLMSTMETKAYSKTLKQHCLSLN